MVNLNNQNSQNIDVRKRRRTFKFVKKVQRISAVVLAWLVGAAILYGIYITVFLKPYFKVEQIEIKGEYSVLTKEEIIRDSNISIGDHLLRIPVGKIQKKLTENPWVKEAAVHRKLPHMAWIYVNEYKPEAIVKANDWYYIDKEGTLFKKVEKGDEKDFPVITGLEKFSKKGFNGEFESKVMEILAVKELYENSQLNEMFGLSELHYSKNKGVSIITLGSPMELRLGFGPFREKIDRLQTIYPAILSHGGVIAYVDLNSDGKVVVKYGT